MNYTTQQIKTHLAKLDGYEALQAGDRAYQHNVTKVIIQIHNMPDYPNDMNLLFHLAFDKYEIDLTIDPNNKEWRAWYRLEDINAYDEDPKQALINCLMKIEV